MSPTWTKSALFQSPQRSFLFRLTRSPSYYQTQATDGPLTSLPKIAFLNRCYWPDSEATGQLLTQLCERLTKDFDVHVVCGQPNSPYAGAEYLKTGVELRDGVHMHRLAHTQFAKRVPAGRIINLVSFSRAASRYLRKVNLQPDILVSETDPFLLPIVAAKHAKRTGSKLVCYLQDIYPDVAEAIGKVGEGFVTRQIRSRLKASYDAADRVIVLGSCMRDRLQANPWSLDAAKVRIVPNWADCSSIRPLPIKENPFRQREELADRFVVMHSGNMGLTQRLNVLIQATQKEAWPENAILLLVGDGASKNDLQALSAALAKPQRVRFLPYQPREKLAESLSAADLHVVSMHENITGCLCPSKMYGILAAGRPLLAIAGEETDLCQTVARHRVGWCCEPGQDEAIAAAVAKAACCRSDRDTMGTRARELALANFDREVVMQQFADVLWELTDEKIER